MTLLGARLIARAGAITEIPRARRKALGLANLPDVRETAYHLTSRELHALTTAWQAREGWRVADEFTAELAREGLCDIRGPFLTAFGMAVRRAVRETDA